MDRRNRVEWTVLSIGVIAVAGVVGLLVFHGLTDTGRPPQPVVNLQFDRAYVTSGGWLLPAKVSNEGDRSAQSVTLRATATVKGREEEAEVSLDYLPAGTEVEATFGFSSEPDGRVTVRVVSFAQ